MEQIRLSEKAEQEIVNAAKMGALATLTENSPNLLTIEDIAIYCNRSYHTVAKRIVKQPTFPRSVYLEDENDRPRYVAGEVVKWVRRYAKRLR